MSRDRFRNFYLNGPEDCLGIANRLQEMLLAIEEEPTRYDGRMRPILLTLTGKVAEAAKALVDAGDLLMEFEAEAGGDRTPGALKSQIDRYLSNYPL